MDLQYPKTKSEAQDHIRSIRLQKGLGDNDEHIGHNAPDLEAALGVLSHDLYQTTTHFLLELIQNADDNLYDSGKTPTVSISYSRGRIRIDCNERGFAKQHVDAICRICKSTKSGRSKSAGFVGEKGIGFKAVFKVASTVWVSSGHYSFRFNRDGHLGMIAPIWDDDLPEARVSRDGTAIFLQLASDCDEGSIVQELERYDPKILMFLRRLRRVEINIAPPFWKLAIRSKIVLSRQDRAPDQGAERVVLLRNDVKSHYIVWRHTLPKMPKDERRPGISESELVLAFPISADEQHAVVEEQSVHAFLPVKSVGFGFLLQGDFLLTANREEFHGESPWNRRLVNEVPRAFVEAMKYMSRLPTRLRYTWTGFIPCDATHVKLFRKIPARTARLLSMADLLESSDGILKRPKDLAFVPSSFRDSSGEPFIAPRTKSTLAKEYGTWASYMELLGIQRITVDEFSRDVTVILSGRRRHKALYKGKTNNWHAEFCGALSSMMPTFWVNAREYYIVPLPDGSWARPMDGTFVMHGDDENVLPLPQGLDINFVDKEAASTPARRHSFLRAGLKTLSNDGVRDIISLNHHSGGQAKHLPLSALISHAVFLFRAYPDVHDMGDEIWMVDNRGDCRWPSDMYLQSNAPSAARLVLPPGPNKRYGFLHPSYMEAIGGEENYQWLQWLKNALKVATYPRISNPIYDDGPVAWKRSLHPDFEEILCERPVLESLVILRDGWKEYYGAKLAPSTEPEAQIRASPVQYPMLRDHIAGMEVPCTGRRRLAPIREACLPTSLLLAEYGEFAPLLELPDPFHESWEPLMSWLEPGKSGTPEFFAECLRAAREAGDKVPWESIHGLMRDLDRVKATDEPPLGLAMAPWHVRRQRALAAPKSIYGLLNNPEDPLICIPPSEKGATRLWVSAEACYWDGEPWLSDLYGLSSVYQEFEILLRHHAQVQDINTRHLISELLKVKDWSTHSTARIERLLLAVLRHHAEMGETLDAGMMEKLKTSFCWPIVSSVTNEPFDSWASAEISNWVIADRAYLRRQFEGILPVLAFNQDMLFRLLPLLHIAGLEDRLLSRTASTVVEATDVVSLHVGLTKKYRSRARFLLRLVPDVHRDRKHIRDKFGSVEVYLAPSMSQYWVAPCGIRQVRSRTREGAAFIQSDYDGDLRVYMRTGYDAELFPVELADRLCELFNISSQHADLVNVALTAREERVEELFDERGIPPLVEDIRERPLEDYGDPPWATAAASEPKPVSPRRGGVEGDLGSSNQSSRFTRLFAHRRFNSNSSERPSIDAQVTQLPSYSAAVGEIESRGKGDERGSRDNGPLPVLQSLSGVDQMIKEMDLKSKDGVVRAKMKEPQGLMERVRAYIQRDNDAAELLVCDVLRAITAASPERAELRRRSRTEIQAAMSFTDSTGSFGSFLQRLEGTTGRGQGYSRFSYSVAVAVAREAGPETWKFPISQNAVDKFHKLSADKKERSRRNRMHSSVIVPVLAVVSQPRENPRMVFVPDPWDMHNDGKLTLEAASRGKYNATLRIEGLVRDGKGKQEAARAESGFDAVQIRDHDAATWIPMPPHAEKEGS